MQATIADPPKTTHAQSTVRCGVSIGHPVWEEHEERLQRVMAACPNVNVGHGDPNSPLAVAHSKPDDWNCLWRYPGRHLSGQIVGHPLDSWDKLAEWQPPSPANRMAKATGDAKKAQADGTTFGVSLEHGFLFLRLTYLRGFENCMIDIAEENPNIYKLRDIVTDYWLNIVKAHLECGATRVTAGDDLGAQDRLPISPASWRKLIKPAYARIFGLARQHGAQVYLHTDGYILDIIPDLIETGVTTLNPQDLVNGLDNLARLAKGRVDLDLDIDRQRITVFGTPADVDAHIKACIDTLGSPNGGLSLKYGVYEGTPIENIEAVIRAMEAYQDMWQTG